MTLRDNGVVVAGPDTSDGDPVIVEVPGREWTVGVSLTGGPDRTGAVVLAIVTVLLASLIAWSIIRDRAYQRRQEAVGRRNAELARVARSLSFANDGDSVVDIVTSQVPDVVGADHADVGLVFDAGHLTMVRRTMPLDPRLLDRYRRIPLDSHLPSVQALRDRRIVAVEDLEEYQADHPALLADVRSTGVHSAVSAPLFHGDGTPLGVLVVVWDHPLVPWTATWSPWSTPWPACPARPCDGLNCRPGPRRSPCSRVTWPWPPRWRTSGTSWATTCDRPSAPTRSNWSWAGSRRRTGRPSRSGTTAATMTAGPTPPGWSSP